MSFRKRWFPMLAIVAAMCVLSGCGGTGPLPPSDTTAPTVSSVSPPNNALNVSVDSSVMITFSEAMGGSSINAQTITLSTESGNIVEGLVTYSGTTAVFKPSSNLDALTWYSVTIDGSVRDAAGNAMGAPIGYGFKTGIAPDTTLDETPPRVIDVQPGNRKTDVGASTRISIMFSEPMNPSTISPSTIKLSSVAGDITGTVSYAGKAATFTPTLGLSPNTVYVVTVTTGVKDSAGNSMADAFVSNFKTGTLNDTTQPSVMPASVVPYAGSSTVSVNTPISVTFNEPMDALTITASNFMVSEGSSTVPGDITFYGTTAIFTPSSPLKYSTAYVVTLIDAVTDLSGNKMSADYVWSFTTEPQAPDTVQPYLLSTYPGNGQNNVPIYRQITALFSETMLASSVTDSNFIFANQYGVSIPGQATSNGAMVIFTPLQPLAYDTTYIATITSGVADMALNPLVGNSPAGYSWSFTTEAVAVFNITATAAANGSISPSGTVPVNVGSSKTFTITPNANYQVADVLVDGASVGAVTTHAFNNVTADHTISASFAIDTKTITASAGANGSISPSGAVAVNYGASQTFTITPDTGYHIASVTGCGGTLSANSYTTAPITADCAVTASFAINTYSITATAGANGSISPANRIVSYNTTTSFTVTPNPTYHIASVTGCGGSLSGNTYTTGPITGSCTVSASFAVDTHVLTVTKAGTGTGNVTANSGTLSWNGSIGTATYNYGTPITLTAASDVSSTFTGWSGEGCSGTGTCVVSMTAARNVTAIFTIKTFTITASAGANGSISPSGAVTVNYGASQTFTITPATGYYISAVTVDGVLLTGPNALPNTYTFTNVTTATHSIAVDFSLGSYTITATSGTGGAISPSGTVLVSYNGNRAFTIASNAGYHIVEVLVDDVSIGAQSSYTFTSVKDNHTISASFAVNSTSTSISSSLNPSTYGVSVTFTATVTSAYGPPAGTVAFSDGVTPIGTGTLSGGIATFSISTLSAGPHSITAVYNGDENFAASTSSTITQTVNKATASVTPNAASKTYGAPDPTFSGTLSGFLPADNVTAVYSRTAGEPVDGSPYTISATLTPTGVLGNYNITYNIANFSINKATPTINWSKPDYITYGTALSGTQLNATVSPDIPGSFAYMPASGIVLGVGDQTLSVTFTPTDTNNYNTPPTASVLITVNKADQATLNIVAPASLTYGDTATLSSSGGSGAGAVAYSAGALDGCSVSGTTLTVIDASGTCSVTATKAADTNYNSATSAPAIVTLIKADQATLNIVAPASLTYGDTAALSTTGGSGDGAVTYSAGALDGCSVAGNILSVIDASVTCSVTATKAADANYNAVTSAAIPVTLNKATPVITWAAPADITSGTALGTTQLNASATIGGSFVYTPAAGTVLSAGPKQTLSVEFTPSDATNYNNAAASVLINVME